MSDDLSAITILQNSWISELVLEDKSLTQFHRLDTPLSVDSEYILDKQGSLWMSDNKQTLYYVSFDNDVLVAQDINRVNDIQFTSEGGAIIITGNEIYQMDIAP